MERCVESSMAFVFSWCCMCTSLLCSCFRMFHMFIHSWKNILTCLFLHENISSHVRLFMKTYPHMHHPLAKKISSHTLSVHEKISSHALFIHPFVNKSPCTCSPCSFRLSSHHVLSMYLYLKSLMTRWHEIHKPPSVPWCIFVHFHIHVTEKEDEAMKLCKQDFKPGCGLRALPVKIP